MEVIQGKQTNRKVVIAQEIVFAKVLAGNNKVLRDRALKKLKKWLTVRGNGKWTFTEEEFLRIWTGLFYCMWMSDKFLVQEELAESISKLIHCFKKNSDTALLFIKCFNKRILMDWEGLDQYRIDKFNMLVRRFLRQTFVYCKEKNWEIQLLKKLTEIFYNDVLRKDCSLGFILHFISIYPEELAKVCEGKLPNDIVLILFEPFIKLLARSQEDRIRKETENFFNFLMQQSDSGIEFEEQFRAWKEQGFPGEGPHCMGRIDNGADQFLENGDESFSENDEEDIKPLDPRAGSVHVYLPQIPFDPDELVKLFEKHIKSKESTFKGKRLLKSLTGKFLALKRGKFPRKIKKDPIILKTKKKKQVIKKAKTLLTFTKSLNEGPIRTKEFKEISKELGGQSDTENENEEGSDLEIENGDADEDVKNEINIKKKLHNNKNGLKKNTVVNGKEEKLKKKKKKIQENRGKKESPHIENINEEETPKQKKQKVKKKKKKNLVETKENNFETKQKKSKSQTLAKDSEETMKNNVKKKQKVIKKQILAKGTEKTIRNCVETKQKYIKKQTLAKDPEEVKAFNLEAGTKRKILRNWQVQELDVSSPEYYEVKTPKIIRIERKLDESCDCDWEENKEASETTPVDTLEEIHDTPGKEFVPVFWEKAKVKAAKGMSKKGKIFKNPFAELNGSCKSSGLRRISFALDKNMAQENEEYLEEVKNSPKVPFDGSKKPVQSALKSGLSPSPVNPFFKMKVIKI